MFDNIFKVLFSICFITGCVIRGVWVIRIQRGRQKKQSRIAYDREKVQFRSLMFLNFMGMQVIPITYVLTSWLNFADYDLPAWACMIAGMIGIVNFIVALWLLWRSHADLGSNWSPELEILEEHSLITHGVFRYVRHPMYAAHWLWGIAQALLLQNWIAGPAFLVSLTPLYLMRVPREEQMMQEHFGEEYHQYMDRTGRIIPFLRR